MSNISLQFTDTLSHNIKKALKGNLFLTALAALLGAICIGFSGYEPRAIALAFMGFALLAALLLHFTDPFGYLRMKQLVKKAAARVDVTADHLQVEMLDGSTVRFNRESCCEKLSFEPHARMHGYYLNIHCADGREVSIYTSARTNERDALHQALNGNAARPGEYPCGDRPACPACGDKKGSNHPLMA